MTKAEHAATTKGAPHTGLILQRDFRVTPAPPSGAYVIYSGAYKTQAAAAAALAKLHHKFPAAKVIRVQPVGARHPPGRSWRRRTPAPHMRSPGSSRARLS